MSITSKSCGVALLAAALAGCNGLGNVMGGGGGVMPATDVGPPPSMRGAMPNRQARSAQVDEDGAPVATTPTRQLALPNAPKGGARSADAGPRRIDRDDLEGADQGRSASGGSMAPAPSLTPGGVGLGGKF